ncbi:MAG: Fe-S cluster protein [Desulfobulbus sp.]|nr:MAG: Fe-S cluster protein [Desulfobulbus sp.]
MNPLEFVALTPKTNCGRCGHPTCLAFAVAVTKGGAAAGGCPFVDPESLPPELSQEGNREGLQAVDRGQEERDMALVAHLKSKVQALDFSRLAVRLGAKWTPDCPDELRFSYLGRPVALGRTHLQVDGQELVDPRDQILLYNYVAFGGGDPPQGIWVGMESLPNSISKVRTLATYCEQRLSTRFCGRARALEELCRQLGGSPGESGQSADVGVIVPVLPFVPLYLLFWDEDPEDGFDARVKVLFDQRVMDFLDLESLVFAAERLADRLAELESNEQ